MIIPTEWFADPEILDINNDTILYLVNTNYR